MTKVRASKRDAAYPAVSRFVRSQGWTEIGDHKGFGFIVQALDYGGLVFESKRPKTLTEDNGNLRETVG